MPHLQSSLSIDAGWKKYFVNDSSMDDETVHSAFNVLVVGQPKSGKTTLLNFLKNEKSDAKQASFFEFWAVKLDSGDVDAVNFWFMDSVPQLESLIEIAIPCEAAKTRRFLVVLLVSLSKPYEIIDFIDYWSQLIRKRINYTITQSLPNSDSLIIENVDFPLLILVNQCDTLEYVFQSCPKPISTYLAFQIQLRRWSLPYKAAIVFTSLKTGENLELFKSYLFFLAYGSSFAGMPHEESAKWLFLPIGEDSHEKINEQVRNIKDLDICVPIKTYFDKNLQDEEVISNFPTPKLKYTLTPEERIKSLIKEGIDLIENNRLENSDNLNNPNIVNTQIINNILSEISSCHDPPFERLLSCIDDRINLS
ncbi:Cytoplasmic dynein 1 light intermediate chain 2 [Thelohanellus kitauei]|uniref:Dynein light intermediate chain n=1 Tax=Thelohanellus kitauei TaxID=669202 RepID=A0A0C2MC61_THEKT|nr:Cytoplasmic dynein 1 light intermediate chain 2 [Thelohanellus kitauei]